MNHPPYHMRLNKAIDRFIFIDAIRKLEKLPEVNLSEYIYYGLGGPYLEEFRVLSEFWPEIKMVSVERDPDTMKRQKFHRPCRTLRIKGGDINSFVGDYEPNDERSIFWLDYTKLELADYLSFQTLLEKVAAMSVVKITLPAMPRDWDKPDKFKEELGTYMPDPLTPPPSTLKPFVRLLKDMLQIAAQQTLPAAIERTFQPITSFYYTDGSTMFTLTGIVCSKEEQKQIRELFRKWRFSNIDWGDPMPIDVPSLSTKERLLLQKYLPVQKNTGLSLLKALGYKIGEGRSESIAMLKQYADFYKYFPYFIKAEP